MFDNRHCTTSDYSLLVKETDRIISIISDVNVNIEKGLENYIRFIARFDNDVADTLKYKLINKDISPSMMVSIINKHIDELKQQVLVDIREHN